MEPIFLGLNMAALISIPIMVGLFAFAVWFGVKHFAVGIDAEEQARRHAAASPRQDKAA